MLLVDATGYGDNGRFARIEAGVDFFLNTDTTAMTVNKTVGNAVLSHLEQYLRDVCSTLNNPFPVRRINLGLIHDYEIQAIKDLAEMGGILIVDEAHLLKDKPVIAALLKEIESQLIKIIYVVTVGIDSDAKKFQTTAVIAAAL